MEFQKKLVSRNEQKINSDIRQLQFTIDFFQQTVNKLLDIGIVANKNDLRAIFDTPKDYITDHLTKGENLNIGGLKLEKNKLFDLLEKPAGAIELIEKIDFYKASGETFNFHYLKIDCFEIVDSKVVVSENHKETIQQQNSQYIENENQLKAFNNLTNIAEILTELKQNSGGRIGLESELSELFILQEGEFKPLPNILNWYN